MTSKRMLFTELEIGQIFMSVSGEFVKTGEYTAKRTEPHWANSDKVWRFTYNSQVYVFPDGLPTGSSY